MKNNPTKRTLAAMIFGLSSIALCTSYAADSNSMNNAAKNTTDAKSANSAAQNTTDAKNVNKTIISTPHDKVVQTFKNDGLDVEFRYIKGKLEGIKLLNTSKKTIQVNILHEDYVLGPDDYVIINPPNVKHLIIHHHPTTTTRNTVGRLLPHRFGNHYIYNLPDSPGGSTTKSTSTNETGS